MAGPIDRLNQPMWNRQRTVAPIPGSAIVKPFLGDNFNLKGQHIKMIRENQFDGCFIRDPYQHITDFEEICDMFKYGANLDEPVKLRFFSLSLTGDAKSWFNGLEAGSIKTWNEMKKVFVYRFFPPGLARRMISDILSFMQHETENLIDAWIRLQNMIRKCHGHGLDMEQIMKIFYYGLDENAQNLLDAAGGGLFFYKSAMDAYKIMEDMVAIRLSNDKGVINEPIRQTMTFTKTPNLEGKHDNFANKCNNVMKQGPIVSAKLVPEPVEDDFTDDDREDEEMEDENVEPISEPVIKDPKDDEELDKQLQELLSIESGEAEENNEHITAEEFDEILEMNIVEFEQWIEKPPVYKSSDEQKKEGQLMVPTLIEEPPTDSEIQQLQGESLLPFVILSLFSVQIQVISSINVLSSVVKTYNEAVRRKRKLEEASATFLTDNCSDFERTNRYVMIKAKFTVFSPKHFRPPDISMMRMSELSPQLNEILENVHFNIAHNDLNLILKKNFSRKFIQPYDIFWNKMEIESELLKRSFSKKNIFKYLTIPFSNDRFKLHFQNKKLKGMVYHVIHPPNHNHILSHLWFKNLFMNDAQHHCLPQLNSSVGEDPLEPIE